MLTGTQQGRYCKELIIFQAAHFRMEEEMQVRKFYLI